MEPESSDTDRQAESAISPENLVLLTEFLADRDEPCPTCGYDLRGLTRAICPECGRPLHLRLVASTPRLSMLLVLLASLIGTIGVAFVCGLIALTERYHRGWGFSVILATGAVDVIACNLLYTRRAWFLRQRPSTQVTATVLSWVLHAGIVVASFNYGIDI